MIYLRRDDKGCKVYNENENFVELCRTNVEQFLEENIACKIAPLKDFLWFLRYQRFRTDFDINNVGL